jgi:hypothetical protein
MVHFETPVLFKLNTHPSQPMQGLMLCSWARIISVLTPCFSAAIKACFSRTSELPFFLPLE